MASPSRVLALLCVALAASLVHACYDDGFTGNDDPFKQEHIMLPGNRLPRSYSYLHNPTGSHKAFPETITKALAQGWFKVHGPPATPDLTLKYYGAMYSHVSIDVALIYGKSSDPATGGGILAGMRFASWTPVGAEFQPCTPPFGVDGQPKTACDDEDSADDYPPCMPYDPSRGLDRWPPINPRTQRPHFFVTWMWRDPEMLDVPYETELGPTGLIPHPSAAYPNGIEANATMGDRLLTISYAAGNIRASYLPGQINPEMRAMLRGRTGFEFTAACIPGMGVHVATFATDPQGPAPADWVPESMVLLLGPMLESEPVVGLEVLSYGFPIDGGDPLFTVQEPWNFAPPTYPFAMDTWDVHTFFRTPDEVAAICFAHADPRVNQGEFQSNPDNHFVIPGALPDGSDLRIVHPKFVKPFPYSDREAQTHGFFPIVNVPVLPPGVNPPPFITAVFPDVHNNPVLTSSGVGGPAGPGFLRTVDPYINWTSTDQIEYICPPDLLFCLPQLTPSCQVGKCARRPNAREVSNKIGNFKNGKKQASKAVNDMHAYWGMLLTVDVCAGFRGFVPETVSVPMCDEVYDRTCTGNATVTYLARAAQAPFRPGEDPALPPEDRFGAHVNTVSAFIDLGALYGNGDAAAHMWIREWGAFNYQTGELQGDSGKVREWHTSGWWGAQWTELYGDLRSVKTPQVWALTRLFRENHNWWVDQLAANHSDWSGDRLYFEARKRNIATVQAITAREYLAALTGTPLDPYQGYEPDQFVGIHRAFEYAALRYGHQEVGFLVNRIKDGQNSNGGPGLVRDWLFRPDLYSTDGVEPLLIGQVVTPLSSVGGPMIDDLRKFMVGTEDLMFTNIYRGRDVALPDYNSVRENWGLPRYTNYSQITSDERAQRQLEELYGPADGSDPSSAGGIDNIDLYVGGILEDHPEGSLVGPLFKEIIRRQMHELRAGDRFWFENTALGRNVPNCTGPAPLFPTCTGAAGEVAWTKASPCAGSDCCCTPDLPLTDPNSECAVPVPTTADRFDCCPAEGQRDYTGEYCGCYPKANPAFDPTCSGSSCPPEIHPKYDPDCGFSEDFVAMIYEEKIETLAKRHYNVDLGTGVFFLNQRQLDSLNIPGGATLFVDPYKQYEESRTIGSHYRLHWTNDFDTRRTEFNLQALSRGWVGLGFEPLNNTMRGADIVFCKVRPEEDQFGLLGEPKWPVCGDATSNAQQLIAPDFVCNTTAEDFAGCCCPEAQRTACNAATGVRSGCRDSFALDVGNPVRDDEVESMMTLQRDQLSAAMQLIVAAAEDSSATVATADRRAAESANEGLRRTTTNVQQINENHPTLPRREVSTSLAEALANNAASWATFSAIALEGSTNAQLTDEQLNALRAAESELLRIWNQDVLPMMRGSQSIEMLFATEHPEGITEVAFSRAWDAEDVFDHPFESGPVRIIFAFNPDTDEDIYHGPTRDASVTMSFRREVVDRSLKETDVWVLAIVGVFLSLAILLSVWVFVCTFVWPRHFMAKSVLFSQIICIGTIVGYIAGFMVLDSPPSRASCLIYPIFLGLSFALVYAALFAKTWRVWMVFNQADMSAAVNKTTNEFLLRIVFVVVLAEALLLIIWLAISPSEVKEVIVGIDDNFIYVEKQCEDTWIGWMVFVIFNGLILVVGAVLAGISYRVPKPFNDAQPIAIAIYNLVLISTVAVAVGFGVGDGSYNVQSLAKGVSIALGYGFTVFILFFPTTIQAATGKDPKSYDRGGTTVSRTKTAGSRTAGASAGTASAGSTGSVG